RCVALAAGGVRSVRRSQNESIISLPARQRRESQGQALSVDQEWCQNRMEALAQTRWHRLRGRRLPLSPLSPRPRDEAPATNRQFETGPARATDGANRFDDAIVSVRVRSKFRRDVWSSLAR